MGHHFLRWKKQERNKLRLQMTSGQFKGSRVVYLKSFKTLEKASFSEVHQISRNNGYDFQTGNNSGNHTVKTPLISNILFGGLMTNHSYSLSINLFFLLSITNWDRTLHYCLSGIFIFYFIS